MKDILFRLVKMADIGYVTVLYFLSGFIVARLIDTYLNKYDKKVEDKKSTLMLLVEVIFFLWINGMVIYIIRNMIELIPSPFENIYGLKHGLLNELKYAPLLEFTLLYYQVHLTDKLKNLYNRFTTVGDETQT
jgi:predicted PurR-regulated permease PerM